MSNSFIESLKQAKVNEETFLVTATVSKELKDQIDSIVEATGCSMAELIRKAVVHALSSK